MQLSHICDHPHQIAGRKSEHQSRSYKPVSEAGVSSKPGSYKMGTDVCCGPLGTKRKEQTISPTITTSAKMTGNPEAIVVVVVSDGLSRLEDCDADTTLEGGPTQKGNHWFNFVHQSQSYPDYYVSALDIHIITSRWEKYHFSSLL